MGKPLAEALGEVKYGGEFLRWFSEEAVRDYGRYSEAPEGSLRMLVSRKPGRHDGRFAANFAGAAIGCRQVGAGPVQCPQPCRSAQLGVALPEKLLKRMEQGH